MPHYSFTVTIHSQETSARTVTIQTVSKNAQKASAKVAGMIESLAERLASEARLSEPPRQGGGHVAPRSHIKEVHATLKGKRVVDGEEPVNTRLTQVELIVLAATYMHKQDVPTLMRYVKAERPVSEVGLASSIESLQHLGLVELVR